VLPELERAIDSAPECARTPTRPCTGFQHGSREQAEGQRMNKARQPLAERAKEVAAAERSDRGNPDCVRSRPVGKVDEDPGAQRDAAHQGQQRGSLPALDCE